MVCLAVLGAEILAGYFIINTFIEKEHDNVNKGVSDTVDKIVSDFAILTKTIVNTMFRDAAVFRLNGKLLSPSNYSIYLQNPNDILATVIHSQRWLPRITAAEREDYERYYRQFYDPKFQIRKIQFNPTDRTFEITPVPNSSEYYPFTLSEPPFTLTLMGGDFLNSPNSAPFQAALIARELITRSSRISLSIPNNDIEFGIQIYHTIRTDVPASPDPDSAVPPLGDPDTILGQIAIMIRPNVMTTKAAEFLGIQRNSYDLAIYDPSAPEGAQRVYTERSLEDTDIRNSDGWESREVDFFQSGRSLVLYFKFHDDYADQYRDDTDTIILITFILIAVAINLVLALMYSNYKRQVEVQTADIYKRLLSYVNHELRNPLVPITGLVDLTIDKLQEIRDMPGAPDDIGLIISDLHTVRGHTQLMHYIIDDVLTYRMIKERRLKINMETISVYGLVKTLRQTVNAKIRESPGVEFILENTANDLFIYADKFRVSQILLNLINNSIKFTDTGHIKLTVSEVRGRECRFELEDTGCGVSEEVQRRLFQELNQGEGPHYGSGLGLFICKNLVTQMHGKIGYHKRDGGGSVFYFTIPQDRREDTDTDADADADLNHVESIV